EQAACHCEQRFDQRRHVAAQLGAGRTGVGGDGDGVLAVAGQSVLQLVGEQQVGQLRLPVGGIPVVAVFPLQIVEVDRGANSVAHAANRHHPRTADGQQVVL